jgi:hypothetical protein
MSETKGVCLIVGDGLGSALARTFAAAKHGKMSRV